MQAKKPAKVSIIIPTYNSAKHLKDCLESIKNQTYPNIEIIVVDQESTDETLEIAKKFGVKLVVVPKPKFYTPPSRSRNIGASNAQGGIFLHLDSDMSLSAGLVEEIVEKFEEDSSLGALIIHELDLTKGFWSKAKALERRCYWGNDKIESARVVRKEIFEKVGGYDEKISSGEDFDIHRRYKKVAKIGFCENVLYHNLGELSLLKMLRKKFNYGKTAAAYLNKHQESGVSLLGVQLGCFIKNYHLFLQTPWVGLGAIFLKLSEFGAGGLGMMVNRFKKNEKYFTRKTPT